MKIVPLTQGKFAIVDDRDYNWLMQFSWCFAAASVKSPHIGYARNGKLGTMHTALMGHWGRKRTGLVTDHRNSFGTDNRFANLHGVTHKENTQKKRLSQNNKSGFRGVYKYESGVYQVSIRTDQQLHHLGLCKDFEEAKQVRIDEEARLGLTFWKDLEASRAGLSVELDKLALEGVIVKVGSGEPLEEKYNISSQHH